MRICGLVLAAGAGSRFGGPKGLARAEDGEPWVVTAVRMLRDGGCGEVMVAVGAHGDEVAALVPAGVRVVHVDDWADGLSASLRAGLLAADGADVVVVTPVDTPDARASAVARVLAAVDADTPLAGATYRGAPGHPVAIGRAHLRPLAAAVSGDRGARLYLTAHDAVEVECGDLWSGRDIDERP